jgi:glycosyltransferase involved in cell wall biosynthesis
VKVLFVVSGNSRFGIMPFIRSQGESLKRNGIGLDYFLIKGKGLKGYLKNIKTLNLYLRKNKYDILHAHFGLCGWVSLLALSKVPVIISFMGSDLYGSADERGRKFIKDYIFIYANKLLQVFMANIIVKSENLADNVLFKRKMQIIPNGVDFEVFKPLKKENVLRALSISPDIRTKYILFLGDRNNTRKNFALLEKAIQGMSDIRLLTPFPIDNDIVPYYLNLADVLVLTSYKEGSPNVIKEAMACNCPIVATDVGDIRKVIGETEGCYITPFKPDEVKKKINKALQFGKRTNGREKIKHLEINSVAKSIIRVYEEVLK